MAGRYKDAAAEARRGMEIASRIEGPNGFLRARARLDLGQALIEVSTGESRKELDTTLEELNALVGSKSPLIGRTHRITSARWNITWPAIRPRKIIFREDSRFLPRFCLQITRV